MYISFVITLIPIMHSFPNIILMNMNISFPLLIPQISPILVINHIAIGVLYI